MKYTSVYRILVRTISVEFYRLNAGFFFIIIAFAFGILRPIEHIALAAYIVHSDFLLACLFIVWTLYTIKTIRFTLTALTAPENQFLYQLYLLPISIKFTALLLVQTLLYQPILLYSAFIGYYAVEQARILSLALLIGFNLLSITAGVLSYVYYLRFPNQEKKVSRLSNYIHQKYSKPYFIYFLYQVFHKHLSTFGLTKVFSLLLISISIKLYTIENYSQILLSIGMLVAFIINVVFAFHFNRFEQSTLLLFKNLPVSLRKRFLYNLLTHGCLLLPEIIVLIRYIPTTISIEVALILMLFGISLQLIMHSYILYKQPELDIFIRHAFFIFLFYFICILFRADLLVIALLNVLAAYLLYQKYFYQSEIIILKETQEE